jgi:hypothetical protein
MGSALIKLLKLLGAHGRSDTSACTTIACTVPAVDGSGEFLLGYSHFVCKLAAALVLLGTKKWAHRSFWESTGGILHPNAANHRLARA